MSWPRQIYFLRREDGEGPIKIGCSRWPKDRVPQISCAIRHKVCLLAVAPGGLEVERGLHDHFASHRISPDDLGSFHTNACPTEWFSPVPELLSLIGLVVETGTIPLELVSTRNTIICARRAAGETLQSIASDVGLTRERVRQIVYETNRGLMRRAA